MSTGLSIDVLKTPLENIVALVHHTYPGSIGYVDSTNYTFVPSVEEVSELGNTSLLITALGSASLTGSKSVFYNRMDISGDVFTSEEVDVDAFEASAEFELLGDDTEFTRSEEVADMEGPGVLYTYTAAATSLLYTGKFSVFIADPAPESLEEVLDGEDLNGFVEPV